MNRDSGQNTLLQIPLMEEKYGRAFFASIAFHGVLVFLIIFGGYLLPQTPIIIGASGPGGGTGGESTTVGVVENLSGGAGMVKPSLIPQPPALPKEEPVTNAKAIPLPGIAKSKVNKPAPKASAKAPIAATTNVIPTANELGNGGMPGSRSGSGGGSGGGNGISIGIGSGGIGDSGYARTVEARISSNWIRPPEGMIVEMAYSFYVAGDGTIYGIKCEKSSGNQQMDLTAERALSTSNPLSPPPLEYRGRPIQFVARFIHPPNR
jgi:hypothetical protein